MSKALLTATALAAASVLAHAQNVPAPATAPAPAAAPASVAPLPSSPAKRELVARILRLQQPGIELMGRSLAEQPAMQLMQQAGAVIQNVPQDRREALARDIEADVRKYAEEATPLVRDRALRLAPSTIGALLEERFTEDELRQIIALLESPVNRKFQSMAPDMQRAIAEKLVTETRPDIEPKVRAMEQSVRARLTAARPAASAPATGAPRPPAAASAPVRR